MDPTNQGREPVNPKQPFDKAIMGALGAAFGKQARQVPEGGDWHFQVFRSPKVSVITLLSLFYRVAQNRSMTIGERETTEFRAEDGTGVWVIYLQEEKHRILVSIQIAHQSRIPARAPT